MKKLLFVITIVIACFSFCIVKADTISFSGDTEFSGNSFSINVNVNATNKLEAAVFPITYDKNKITIDSNLSDGQNGFTMEIAKNIVFDENSKTGNFTIGKIVFNATDNFKVGESTTITLGNGKFSDDTNETSVKGTSITVKRIQSSNEDDTPTCTDAAINFKLTYVTNGGTAIPTETITKNTTGGLPTPEKENNTFKGWYYDSALTKPVAAKSTKLDLAKPMTDICITGYSDVTIYAKWDKKLVSDDNTDNNDDLSGNTGSDNKDDSSNNTDTDNKDNSSNNTNSGNNQDKKPIEESVEIANPHTGEIIPLIFFATLNAMIIYVRYKTKKSKKIYKV